jgi:regulator of sigma D
VTYLVGRNGSGKSTIAITGVQAIMQGIAEKASQGTTPLIGERFRFIGSQAATSKNQLTLIDEAHNNAEIIVTRKITKSGSELSFQAPADYPVPLDQQWLNNLFNIFLIAPKKFTELSPKEQAKAIGIDTKPIDDALTELKKEFTAINAVYKSYGEIAEVAPVEKVDIDELKKRKDIIVADLNNQYTLNKKANKATNQQYEDAKNAIYKEVEEFNAQREGHITVYEKCVKAVTTLEESGYEGRALDEFISTLKNRIEDEKDVANLLPPAPTVLADMPEEYTPKEGELVYVKELPDNAALKEIDEEIANASQVNENALRYTQFQEKKAAKEAKYKELEDNRKKQAAKEQERIEYVKSFKFPFSNLSVGEDGELLLNGKPIKEPYFSTGEIIKIVVKLMATTNPTLKYVYIQNALDLDEDNLNNLEKELTENGFQLVLEVVGKEKISGKNCILLKDNTIVDSYNKEETPELL